MFRFISALGRTFEVANSYGNLAVILQLIVSGYVMAKPNIPDWWIWVSGGGVGLGVYMGVKGKEDTRDERGGAGSN